MRVLPILLATAAAAFADGSVPETARDPVEVLAVPATGPLAYRFAWHNTREHSCSQSFESDTDSGTLTLAVAADGSARLTLDGSHSSTFGPSPGRYRAGARDFQHSSKPVRGEWTGTAVRRGPSLTLALGSAPRLVRIECRLGRIPVPSGPGNEAPPGERGALLCSPADALDPSLAEVAVGGALAFGRSGGWEAVRWNHGFGGDDSVRFRRAAN